MYGPIWPWILVNFIFISWSLLLVFRSTRFQFNTTVDNPKLNHLYRGSVWFHIDNSKVNHVFIILYARFFSRSLNFRVWAIFAIRGFLCSRILDSALTKLTVFADFAIKSFSRTEVQPRKPRKPRKYGYREKKNEYTVCNTIRYF